MHFTAILCGQFSQRFVKFSQRIHAWREALPSDKFPHRLLAPKLRYSRAQLKQAGQQMYVCCAEAFDYHQFIKDTGKHDLFQSWFDIVFLHIWVCMVRLHAEGREGRIVAKSLSRFLWHDVQKRLQLLPLKIKHSERTRYVKRLQGHVFFAVQAYDEGLLSDDRALAGALWQYFYNGLGFEQLQYADDNAKALAASKRYPAPVSRPEAPPPKRSWSQRLFGTKEPVEVREVIPVGPECISAQQLERVLQFARKNVRFVELQSSESLVRFGVVRFLSLAQPDERAFDERAFETRFLQRMRLD